MPRVLPCQVFAVARGAWRGHNNPGPEWLYPAAATRRMNEQLHVMVTLWSRHDRSVRLIHVNNRNDGQEMEWLEAFRALNAQGLLAAEFSACSGHRGCDQGRAH